MELGKYIRAMRPKKYLTREFKVYDASMADDNTIDTMSTDAPPMDNVMPYTDGLEDPRNRQLELADGGIVEREEFSEGTTPAYLKNIFEKAYQENNYNIDDLYEQAISKKNELYETTKKGSYKTPTTKKKILRSFKEYVSSQKAMSPEVYTKYIKERIQNPSLPHIEGWNKPLLGTPLEAEKIGKTKNVRVTNLRKAESMLSPEELKQWRDYTRSEQRKVKYQRKFQKSERFNPETGKFEYDPKIKQEALAKKYLTKNIRRAIRNESYEKLTPIEKNKYLDFEKRLNTMGTIIKENPKYLLDDKEVMNKLSTAVDPQTGEIYKKTPTFTDIKNRRIWEIEHIDPIVEGQTKGRGSFLRNLQVLPEPIHKNFKNNAESFLNKHYGDPKYQSQVDNIINEAKNLKVELRVRDVGRVGYKPQFTNFADKAEDIISTYVKNPKARQAYIQTTGTVLKEEPVVAAKNFTNNEEVVTKKMNTLISNIGCPTGTLKASEGANCYIKGVEKIKTNNLNQNEFNILRKAVNSPAAQTALKYGKGALKVLGPILTPLVAYDTFKSYKEGKPAFEILEEGLIGTGLARGIREAQTYTPEEREAIAQKKQYAREEEDYSGLSSDFNIPSNMSADQIDLLSVTGPKRVEEKLAAEDAARAAERVYEGDPGFISETGYDVEERVGFKKGSKDKDSPVIPISPLTDLPQNESRRDFLKGIGAVGLGAVALGSGLLKLGKAAAPISEITKIVKGTTAPSWMDSLITKILKEGVELKLDPNSNVLVKKVKFKNPKTGVEEEATLTFDKQKNSYEIEYSSDETVGGKYGDKVFLKVEPEYVYDPQSQKMVPTGKHKFNAIEAEPEIVNPDGDIEMTGENVASKIIDLRSDISGLKSYVTGGKGINKKVVKEKEALVKRAEEDPLADIEDNPRYSPRHYDLDEFSN
jgi:hypothetical protein